MSIVCTEVSKKYRGFEALRNMSFTIEENKVVGLIGRNGAGKSTLLKLLAGHLKVTSGDIKIFEEKPFNSIKVSSNLIFIEDTMSFPPIFTLGELFDRAKDFYPNWQDELARRLLSYANISEKSYHYDLSKGQKSTFNLIYGLAARCAITLLDEPMNGMDEAIRSDMYRAILKEYIAFPRTIILSSHHLQEIEHLLEEILLLDGGQLTLHASLEDTKQLLVKVIGEGKILNGKIKKSDVLFESTNAIVTEQIVEASAIKFIQKDLVNAGVVIQPISASEVCKYLTHKGKGAIDDVFK